MSSTLPRPPDLNIKGPRIQQTHAFLEQVAFLVAVCAAAVCVWTSATNVANQASASSQFPGPQTRGETSRMEAYRRLSEAREHALADVLDLDEEILRGVSLPSLLAGGARLFADDGATARLDPTGTFAVSRPVESVSYFISHSWRTSRLLKYCAFCIRFNLERAAIASACANFIAYTVSLFCLDSLPEWMVADFFHVSDYAASRGTMMCEATGILVFTSVLLLGHLIFDRRDTFFLDVACISQDDEKLKASGIASLGAILDRSERMLVLCDGNYFSRLWCCA